MKPFTLTVFALAISTLTACGSKKQEQLTSASTTTAVSSLQSVQDKTTTLVSRYTDGDYVTATYSFRHSTRDNVELTHNNWDLLFEAREDFADYFTTEMVVDDVSYIFDLGERSCQDIKSAYPEDRNRRPMIWFAYSEIELQDFVPATRQPVRKGHCYLVVTQDEDGSNMSLFHVADHTEDKSVVLDQIEVLNNHISR